MILMNPFPLGVSMRKSVPLLRKIASENRVVAISVDGEGKNPVIAEKNRLFDENENVFDQVLQLSCKT